jgi:hypothetical protein
VTNKNYPTSLERWQADGSDFKKFDLAKYFNKMNFIEILQDNTKDQKKFVNGISFEVSQLQQYKEIFWQQVLYHNRREYINLVKKFHKSEIGPFEFKYEFFYIHYHHRWMFENLLTKPDLIKRFVITPKADGLLSILNTLYGDCDYFEDDLDLATQEYFCFIFLGYYDELKPYEL